MICPKCGTEYRAGFAMCADCHIPLVTEDREPVEMDAGPEPEGDNSLVQVLESMAPSFVSDVVVAIERAHIPYILESGTAFELARTFAGRKSYPEWRAYVYVPAGYKDEFIKILIRVKARPSAPPEEIGETNE